MPRNIAIYNRPSRPVASSSRLGVGAETEAKAAPTGKNLVVPRTLTAACAAALLLIAISAAALPDPANADSRGVMSADCGGVAPRASGGMAVKVTVTPATRAALRRRLLDCYRGPDKGRIKGPLAGTVHLARYRGYEWAIATFSFPATGTTDQPERFIRRIGRQRWRDLGDTGGPLSERLPCPLLRAWRIPCS
jgi:hypothetical protein